MKAEYSTFKRYGKTLTLKDNSKLIGEYKRIHKKENQWPEITKGMQEVGILNMEIYLHHNQLFMIMDIKPDLDHGNVMEKLAQKPRQAEWEEYVARFQQSSEEASADDKWQIMERIFKM